MNCNTQNQSSDESDKLRKTREKENRQTAICANFDKSIVLWSPGDIGSMVLHEGFNLHRMPKNYLTRKSYIEKLIYHATMSDSIKSPFAGFKVANEYLNELDHIDVISGIKTFKSFIRSFFKNNSRTSTMIHKIGRTWLLNEFDIDSFLLSGGECHEWLWLREFLKKEDYRLCSHSLSRNVLISNDLESKFLYHTVFQSPELGLKKIQMLQPKSLPSSSGNDHAGNEITKEVACTRLDPSSVGVEHLSMVDVALSSSLDDTVTTNNAEQNNESRQFRSSWVINPDQYLHTAEWQLKDLSFIVGSDMPIFGTPKHPCISLKLSPLHESINVLTGIDVWLENIINEVPEVAMCYHHEGIVMQEYEIYKTCEIPPIIGFETEQINQIIRNLVMFLKRNATQEGHTYWLVKEPGLGVVKLYDLTTLGYKEFLNKCSEEPNGREAYMKDNNPFILPVASLCYKLAEIRVKEYIHYRETQIFQSTTFDSFNSTSSSSSPRRYSTDNNDFNEITTVMDALRLLRNCLNLISVHENFSNVSDLSGLSFNPATTSPGIQDLKFRAVLLLCRLYLITPTNVIMTCFKDIQGLVCASRETVSVNIEQFGKSLNSSELNTFTLSDENEQITGTTTNDKNSTLVSINSNRNYLGSMIIDALRKSNTSQLSELAISILGSFNRNLAYGHHRSNLTNTNDRDKMLTPYSSSVNNHHHQNCSAESYDNDSIMNKNNEMNDSQTYSLPFAVLKSYIAKSEELWFMVYQQMHHTDTILNPIVIESLNMIFQYTLPALMLLEHLVPDRYIHCFTPNEQHEKQIQLSMKKPICPYCYSSCDLIKDSLDRCCLSDTLFIVSCLFSAAFISYPEAIQRTNLITTSNHHYQQDKKKDSELLTPSVDTFIMQSACEQSKMQMKIYLNTVLSGPVKLSKKLSSSIEKFSDDDSSGILTKYTNWFNALNLAACCLQRVFLQSTNTTNRQQRQHHSRRSNSSMMTIMKQRANKFESSHDLKAYMNKLKITNDWWSVLMNMFVCCLRSMWLDCVSDNQDEIIHLNFNKLLDQYLNILLCNPFDSSCSTTTTSTDIVDVTNNNNNSSSSISMVSYQLIDTNEFQLYKLLALCSQSSLSSSSSSTSLLPWANKLSSLKKWRSNEDHLLPNETLYFNQQYYSKTSILNNMQNYKKFQFSLTTVCLARSIETLLHYQLCINHNQMPSIQICLDLLLTTNEYLSICLEEFKSIQGDKLEYLDIINNVLKQVLRYLPSDLTPYSITSSSTTSSLTTTENDSTTTNNTAVNKDILRIFVNLRLHQLNVMLLRHHHGVTFKRGKSQTPAWFTMITQARTTLDWHASYLASNTNIITSKGEDKHLNIDLQDVILHVTLLNHLVSLQTVNQDVLSIFGIQAILRDICRIHPILKLLTSSPDYFTTNPLYSNLQGPLNSISNNLTKLCDTLARKSQTKRENKSDLKLTNSQHVKKTKQKNSGSNNNRLIEQNIPETNDHYHENFSPESLLLSNIKKQQQQQDNFLTTKQTMNEANNSPSPQPSYQAFNNHCQVLQCQIEHLTKYLSEL